MGCVDLLKHPLNSCYQCGNELVSNTRICGECQRASPYFSSSHYACLYQAPVDAWVMALKFSNKLNYSRLFAELLLPQQLDIDDRYVLMPVPLHLSRLRSRGYNQAYEMAKELAKPAGRELHNNLIRRKKTAMQAELNLKQRAQNVHNAFVLKSELKAQHIILVDDVMTTGFTLNACAKTLINAGAKDVKVLVFARKQLI